MKANGGVRPIALQEVFVRLVAGCVAASERDAIAAALPPWQVGVATPGGAEVLGHAARDLMTRMPDWIFVGADVRNAYSEARRDLMCSPSPLTL